jgi:hypothetical protein
MNALKYVEIMVIPDRYFRLRYGDSARYGERYGDSALNYPPSDFCMPLAEQRQTKRPIAILPGHRNSPSIS